MQVYRSGILSKGSISIPKEGDYDWYKRRYKDNLEKFSALNEKGGVKEINIENKRYRGKLAILSKELVPTGGEAPAFFECKDYMSKFQCTVSYNKHDKNLLVSYTHRYDTGYVEDPDYLGIYHDAERWVSSMMEAAEDYKEKVGAY